MKNKARTLISLTAAGLVVLLVTTFWRRQSPSLDPYQTLPEPVGESTIAQPGWKEKWDGQESPASREITRVDSQPRAASSAPTTQLALDVGLYSINSMLDHLKTDKGKESRLVHTRLADVMARPLANPKYIPVASLLPKLVREITEIVDAHDKHLSEIALLMDIEKFKAISRAVAEGRFKEVESGKGPEAARSAIANYPGDSRDANGTAIPGASMKTQRVISFLRNVDAEWFVLRDSQSQLLDLRDGAVREYLSRIAR